MQFLRDAIFSVTATNLVDIFIIAGLIYSIFYFLKGTRSLQILVTLIAIGFIYLAASRVGLVLTSALFQYLWAAIIVVLVIVFQPEIREMLDRASPIRYLTGRRMGEAEPGVLDEVVSAVTDLARQKTGALIVFQRGDRLRNLIALGKPMESVVSSEILEMIFQKSSPLHDGAVLIVRDRIRSVGCILPLSTDESLGVRFGTRHRAAFGLAERSDALCVVVSEERGEVSIVQPSGITNYNRKEEFRLDLERALASDFLSQDDTPPRLTEMLISNWRLKLAALFVSILIWFAVVGPQSSEVGMTVPIQYTNLPAGMEITGKWMDRVDVRLRGSEASLTGLAAGSVRAVVDLQGVVAGLNFFRLSGKNLQVPPGVTISKIRPSDLQLNVEAMAEKRYAVALTLNGVIPEKVKVVITPPSVKVRALEDTLELVQSVVTESVKVSDLLEKKKVVVPVAATPDDLKVEAIYPAQVAVSVEGKDQ
jgi:uncharacterized protein (TIGR00159 family)